MDEPLGCCEHYCSHGGRCEGDFGHEGDEHWTKYCRWNSKDSLTKDQADQLIASTPGGSFWLSTEGQIEEIGDAFFQALRRNRDQGS